MEVEPPARGSTSLNWSIDQQTGKLTTTYGLDLGGNSLQNVSAILSASGNWVGSKSLCFRRAKSRNSPRGANFGEDGKLVVTKIETQKLKVGSQEKPEGITIYDELTGQPGCVKLTGGVVQAAAGACGNVTTDTISPSPSFVPEPDIASSTP